ncbi:MAG: c-type cytochrome [bacterium]
MSRKIRLRSCFLWGTVVGIAVLVLSSCEKEPSWQYYQDAYQEKKTEASQEKLAKQVRKQEVEIPELGIRDRCTSCHIGVQDVSMFGEENPLKPHPAEYLKQHPTNKFGCTTCHGGNGEALNAKEAHSGGFLKGELAQVSCSKCHTQETLAGAPNVSRGQSLLKEYQCTQCHYVQNFSEMALFRPAPSLKGLGNKVTDKWLRRWLTDPKSYMTNARMPKYQVDDKYIDALVGYLSTAQTDTKVALDFPEGDPDRGKGVLRLAFCITCHSFNEKGGKDAPDLGKIGNKVQENWIPRMLADPHAMQPKTTMPKYNLSAQQMSDIGAYLMDEFTDYDLLEQDDTTKVVTYWADEKERVEVGRKVYKELRCANCHGLLQESDGWLKVGPDLSFIGSKSVDDVDFGDSSIPRTLPDYLFEKIRNPQAFTTESNLLKMPQYDLPDRDIKDMVLALLSFNSDTLTSQTYRQKPVQQSQYEPKGEFGRLVNKFRCFSCHSFKGRGHNITYDLTLEGSRVSRDWLYNYLKLSYTIRPILTIRMPIFNMSDEEAQTLTEGFMREMVSDEIPKNLELTSEMVEEGEKLFKAKGCLACHQVGTRGGYVAPSFTQGAMAGDKLQAGWIFKWLKNPQAIKPDVLEPNYSLSDTEALQLTAYLMSMKSNDSKGAKDGKATHE